MENKQIVLAVTGASGAIYARRLLKHLLDGQVHVHLIVSGDARTVIAQELDGTDLLAGLDDRPDLINTYDHHQMNCSLASGSFVTSVTCGMIVCPCSLNTLGSVAGGLSSNLIWRAAQVHLKQVRPLILAIREMPLGQIDITNMLRVSRAGGVICPLCPPFYMNPRNIEQLVDGAVARILDLLNIEHQIDSRWSPPDS